MTLQGKGLGKTILPHYFYDLEAITDENRPRWVDQFAGYAEHILQPGMDDNPAFLQGRFERNRDYAKWIASFFHYDPDKDEYVSHLKPGLFKWQAIRVLESVHSETSRKDWWPNYRDCLFRVFINPQTFYDDRTGEHKQWYLLCPEDCYLVNRQEIVRAGGTPPVRSYSGAERYFSRDKNLRQARLIPVECCHHLRNEGKEYTQVL